MLLISHVHLGKGKRKSIQKTFCHTENRRISFFFTADQQLDFLGFLLVQHQVYRGIKLSTSCIFLLCCYLLSSQPERTLIFFLNRSAFKKKASGVVWRLCSLLCEVESCTSLCCIAAVTSPRHVAAPRVATTNVSSNAEARQVCGESRRPIDQDRWEML